MNPLLQTLFGLKFNPFRPDIPIEALYISPAVDAFLQRCLASLHDGGFALITGDPGTGKSAALRLVAHHLHNLPEVLCGVAEHSQTQLSDFYRQLGDLFAVPCSPHNRWGGFKALRSRWAEHFASSAYRPVLLMDEAQDTLNSVFAELRILSSKDLDSKQLLCILLCGDHRLTERLREPALLPLGSRIRRRLLLDYATKDQLVACLEHLLRVAGNSQLMTPELMLTLAEHAAGNYRILTNLADELLTVACERKLSVLDDKLFLETFAQTKQPKPLSPRKR